MAIVAALFTVSAWAAPVAKYSGNLEIAPNKIHKDGVKAQIKLMFEGDALAQVTLKTEKPVMGRTDFASSEQTLFSKVDGDKATMAVIFKLAGTPHKWYYTLVTESADKGKNFAGNMFKAPASVDDIKKALDSGTVPADWVKEGTGSFVQATE